MNWLLPLLLIFVGWPLLTILILWINGDGHLLPTSTPIKDTHDT